MRKVYFVKYYDKGSTVLGADQMSAAMERLGTPARSIYAEELPSIRDAILVFVKRGNILHLAAARARGNRCVLDVQDQVVFRYWISHWPLYHGFIFKNRRQLQDFGGWFPRGLCRTIYHQWDPRYSAHSAGEEALHLGYLGTQRSISLWDQILGVTFIGPDHWFDGAPALNAHLSLRETRREWLYKPNMKVATAAACEAVLLTTPDCASVELLGEDYPFYLDGLEKSYGADRKAARASIARGIERLRDAVGGPLWRDAVERMRAIKAATTIEKIAGQYLEMFEELG